MRLPLSVIESWLTCPHASDSFVEEILSLVEIFRASESKILFAAAVHDVRRQGSLLGGRGEERRRPSSTHLHYWLC